MNNKRNKWYWITLSTTIVIVMITILTYIYLLNSQENVAERMKICSDNNMTYVHITMLDGSPAKIDYCGQIEDIIEFIKDKQEGSSK